MSPNPTSRNRNLHAASKAKNDEFYTQLSDIQRELFHYQEHFKDKIVFCNCDDPEWSNFWKYFELNFRVLQLKKLISTHFEPDKPSYKLELEYCDGELKTTRTDLIENGDFRSQECIELLKEADIVVTNPPFSLFREYIATLVEHGKQFVVIGNNNSITYKEIFKLIKENRLWLGVSPRSMTFRRPDDTFFSVNASWFTNMAHKKRSEEMILYKTYAGNEGEYPKYDNYDAIEVSKTNNIPMDYDGAIGVPITFLDKYNPEQFEIVGIDRTLIRELTGKVSRFYINEKEIYARIIIKNKKLQGK